MRETGVPPSLNARAPLGFTGTDDRDAGFGTYRPWLPLGCRCGGRDVGAYGRELVRRAEHEPTIGVPTNSRSNALDRCTAWANP